MPPTIDAFFDPRTYTLTYVVHDPETLDAVVIDPVLDYDPAASKIWSESAREVLAFIQNRNLNLHFILETHAHADHLSGSKIVKKTFPNAQIAIGERITVVQQVFKAVFGLPADFPTDGSQFDRLFTDGEVVQAGSLQFEVIATPGHTPACVTYRFDDAIFTGDTLFMADAGTGRCDFPGGSAIDLYHAIQDRIYTLPPNTRVFVGHDYQPHGRELRYQDTVANQRENNVALPASRDKDDFVNWRRKRDATLNAPKLLFQSIQVNVDAGALPKPDDNQRRYLRIPINAFRGDSDGELALDTV